MIPVPLQICQVAPPGAQQYADQLTGYVLCGVLALFVVGVVIALGAVVAGRIFGMPHASRAGVIGAVVVFIAAIAYMVLPSMVAAITGSGCIG